MVVDALGKSLFHVVHEDGRYGFVCGADGDAVELQRGGGVWWLVKLRVGEEVGGDGRGGKYHGIVIGFEP